MVWGLINYFEEVDDEILDDSDGYDGRGDVVAWDWNNNGVFDHIGILVFTNKPDQMEWDVISCNGLKEVFDYEVDYHSIGAMRSSSAGGWFDWRPYNNNWNYGIYRYKYNN